MIEKLFLEYGYKDFQHQIQSVDSKKLAEEFKKCFLKEKLNYVEMLDKNIVGVASLRPFSTLSKIWKRNTVFLKDFVAKDNEPKIYQSLLKNILKKYKNQAEFVISKQPIDNSNAINVVLENGFYYICSEAIYTLVIDQTKNINFNQKNFGNIRVAYKDEIGLIKKIAHKHNKYNRYLFDKAFKLDHVGQLYEKVIEESFFNPNHNIYVYEEVGEICGFITTIVNSRFSKIMGEKYGSLDYITVNEKFQKKGIGQALTNYGLNQLCKQGVNVISVKTMSNNYPAIKLLTKDNFFITSENVILHNQVRA